MWACGRLGVDGGPLYAAVSTHVQLRANWFTDSERHSLNASYVRLRLEPPFAELRPLDWGADDDSYLPNYDQPEKRWPR
eukprot:2326706-Prymnesium_polylepis.1